MKKTLLGDVHMLQAKKAKLDSSNEIADASPEQTEEFLLVIRTDGGISFSIQKREV